ncbi:MAG: isoprenylcysteine carboxylmethyltransferase family protein [Candidatus Dormibacteria bacterium]
MTPSLVLRDPAAATLFFGSLAVWGACECALVVRDRRAGMRRPPASDRNSGALGVAAGGAGLLASIGLGLQPLLPLPSRTALAMGLCVLWAGLALRLWAVRTLGRFFRLVVIVQDGHKVIEDGPYRAVRHPSYTGVIMVCLGAGIAVGDLATALVAGGCMLAGLLPRIRYEEAALAESLGEPWRRYAAMHARLVPRVW